MLTKAKIRLCSENFACKGETRLPSKSVARKDVYAFIEGKRGTENRKRVYISKTSLAKSKTLLSSENVAHKIENALTEQNRRIKRRKRVYPLKTCLPSGNPYTSTKSWLARGNRTKTWLTKVQTCLSRENVLRKGGNAFYRESDASKSKKAFPERIRVYIAKISFA